MRFTIIFLALGATVATHPQLVEGRGPMPVANQRMRTASPIVMRAAPAGISAGMNMAVNPGRAMGATMVAPQTSVFLLNGVITSLGATPTFTFAQPIGRLGTVAGGGGATTIIISPSAGSGGMSRYVQPGMGQGTMMGSAGMMPLTIPGPSGAIDDGSRPVQPGMETATGWTPAIPQPPVRARPSNR